jgi:hypothetical protein
VVRFRSLASRRRYRQLGRVALWQLPLAVGSTVATIVRFVEDQTFWSWGWCALFIAAAVWRVVALSAARAWRVRIAPLFLGDRRRGIFYDDAGYTLARYLHFVDSLCELNGLRKLSELVSRESTSTAGEWHDSADGCELARRLLASLENHREIDSFKPALLRDLVELRQCLEGAASMGLKFRLLVRFSDKLISPADPELQTGWLPLPRVPTR